MAHAITKNVKGGPTTDIFPAGRNQTEAPTTRTQASRRGIIPGFPHPSSPLPKDIDHDAIIRHYPNHLRGKLLLEIAATWMPKEISETNGRPELKANTIVKRIKMAKMAQGHHLQSATRKQSAKRATTTAAQDPPPPPPPPPPSTSPSASPPPAPTPEFAESQASLKFLEEQLALQKIMKELDSEWADRQSGLRKKTPLRDRMLVKRAVAEYERRRMMGAGVDVVVVLD